MSLRKTSCSACVQAKRRCDRAWPACRRCSKQSLECQYPYPRAAALDPLPVANDAPQGLLLQKLPDLPPVDLMLDETADSVGRVGRDPQLGAFDDESLGFDFSDTAADWFPGFEDTPHLAQGGIVEHDTEGRTFTATLSPQSRKLKKQKIRSRRFLRTDKDARELACPGIGAPLSTYYLNPFNRSREVETWEFCANEMLSYISIYAKTGTSPMMVPSDLELVRGDLHPALGKALGICAAHETLVDTQKSVFDQLLDHELRDLESSSKYSTMYNASGQRYELEMAIKESIARLQAMTMYQIMWLFSNKVRDLQKSAQHEALFASWTRELQLQVQIMQHLPAIHGSAAAVGPDLPETNAGLLETAHRTILLSYSVRGVHSFICYGTCDVWDDLFRIFVPVSLSGHKPMLYPDYVVEWERGLTPAVGGNDGRLRDLLVAACKGVDAVRREATLLREEQEYMLR